MIWSLLVFLHYCLMLTLWLGSWTYHWMWKKTFAKYETRGFEAKLLYRGQNVHNAVHEGKLSLNAFTHEWWVFLFLVGIFPFLNALAIVMFFKHWCRGAKWFFVIHSLRPEP